MKKESYTFKVEQQRRRADFLFNDGQYKPKSVKSGKVYRRKNKHRALDLDQYN